ncbi:cupin domain-containing protein [Hydrogenophaga sp. OTU3427]|uniref:cupin domain-containing protein n=1 Tax=Hydrogenophaga sp. OTU3427 TaxID=3043856 RepID=UPI00313AD6E5
MSTLKLSGFGLPVSGAAELSHPRPERLIQGNPQRETWSAVEAPLAGAATLYSGVWRSEVGHWRIAMGPTEQEVFTVLSGRCRVHGDGGGVQEAGPGQAIHIPAGFTGSFEVLETVTKVYVITE